MPERKVFRIQDLIKQTDKGIELEYGVPLETIPYKRILKIEDDISINTIEASEKLRITAVEKVEEEAKSGRFGAFVTIKLDIKNPLKEIIEVWGWAD